MANIKDWLDEDIRNTMRARNRERLDTLRFLKSQIQLTEKNNLKELDDAGVTDVIAKQVKDRRESIEMFGQGGRADLVAKEEASLAILLEYMPEQLSDADIKALARQAIADTGASGPGDRGKVMGRIMPQVRGKADGSQVNAIVFGIARGVEPGSNPTSADSLRNLCCANAAGPERARLSQRGGSSRIRSIGRLPMGSAFPVWRSSEPTSSGR